MAYYHLHHHLREVVRLSEFRNFRCPELFLAEIEKGINYDLTEDEFQSCNHLIQKGYTKYVKTGEIK